MGIEKVKRHFNFLGFFLGKGFFCLFMGLICFNRHRWYSWACSVLFFISALFYILLGFVVLKDEKNKFREIKKNGTATSTAPNIVRDVNIQQNQNKV